MNELRAHSKSTELGRISLPIAGLIVAIIAALGTWINSIANFKGQFLPASTLEIERLIRDEATLALPNNKDSVRYRELFTADAAVVDVRNGISYFGRDRIVERYNSLQVEFLGHNLVNPPKLVGQQFTAETTSQIRIGGITHTGHEKWWFVQSEGQWKISAFHFNIER